MRILCTNDDGIHAPGLKVIEEIARALSDDVWVVAPELDQSGVSHSLSLNDPLRLREVGPRHFAVRGTPTDCVIMGARHILKDRPPDLVLAGVNRGRNCAEDVTYSGTVAGAMEGAVLGIDTVAIMKGSKKAELAYKFINVALDPQVQAEVAKFKKGSPVVLDAKLDPAIAKLPGVFTSVDQWNKQAIIIDHKLRAEKTAEWRKWFAENIMN